MTESPQPDELDVARVIEAAPSLYLILTADLTIVGATDAYLDATMTRRAEILGRHLFDVFPDNPDDPDATGERNLLASLDRVRAELQPDSMNIQKYDIRRPEGDGTAFEVRYWSPSNWPVLGEDGRLHCIIHRVEDVTELVQLRDAGSLMELELLARTERLREVTEPAREAAAEYRRALRDYTQLMRHRLANPLTAITGGIATLRDLDLGLDRETRLEILDEMANVAVRLERAVLHPETLSDEEHVLRAVPTPMEHDVDAQPDEIEAVRAEHTFRQINHHMATQIDDLEPERPIDFFCECWSPHCTTTIGMTLREYLAIHKRADQFIICPNHEMPSVEHVTEKRDGWWVVRKFPTVLERVAGELVD